MKSLNSRFPSLTRKWLITGVNGELIPAFEVLKMNSAVQNMIREDKLHQLNSVMQSSAAEGMFTMDSYLYDLCKAGRISKQEALLSCVNYDALSKRL
jgi:twitching motility protein PilT